MFRFQEIIWVCSGAFHVLSKDRHGPPAALYFLGGVLEGVGVVFVLSGFLIRNDYVKAKEMM